MNFEKKETIVRVKLLRSLTYERNNVPNGVETLPKISIAWVGRTNVTDRQTDGRTGDDI